VNTVGEAVECGSMYVHTFLLYNIYIYYLLLQVGLYPVTVVLQ
jgi:hypothetical protein